MDSDHVRQVASQMRSAVGIVDEILSGLDRVSAKTEWSIPLSPVRTPCREFDDEAGRLAQVLDTHADLIDAADENWPSYAWNGLQQLLGQQMDGLNRGLDDGVGSAGTADEVAADLEQRWFGPGGAPDAPPGADATAWYIENVLPVLMSGANDADIVALWNSLSRHQRESIIDARPDLVVFGFAEAGVELTALDNDTLHRANAHGVFESEFFVEASVNANLRLVQIEIGGGLSVVMTMMSDGSVKMVTAQNVYGSVGVEGDGRGGEASAHIGLQLHADQTFSFEDEAQAAAAVEALLTALDEDLDRPWYEHVATFGPIVALPGSPLGVVPVVVDWFTGGPSESNVTSEMRRIFDDNGISHTVGIGTRGEIEVEFDPNVPGSDVEAEVAANVTNTAYYTDVADGDDQYGIRWTAVVSGDIESDIVPLPGMNTFPGYGSGELGLTADVHNRGGEWYTTITVFGETGIGNRTDIDTEIVEAGVNVEAVGRFRYQVEVPVNADTRDILDGAASEIAAGDLPVDALHDLYEHSDVTIVQEQGTRVTSEIEIDAARLVEIEIESGAGVFVPTASFHKYPGGDLYDQTALDQLIDTGD